MLASHLRVVSLRFADGVDLPELRSIEMGSDAFAFGDRSDSTLVMKSGVVGYV